MLMFLVAYKWSFLDLGRKLQNLLDSWICIHLIKNHIWFICFCWSVGVGLLLSEWDCVPVYKDMFAIKFVLL